MKISWSSNAPWSTTGYGNQTRVFAPRLKKLLGHDVAITCWWGLEGGVLNWDGISCYPRAYHPYGNDCYSAHAKHFGAQLVISLMDIWVLEPGDNTEKIPLASWFPVDSEPLPPPVKAVAEKVDFRIVFSRFGERMVREAGLDCLYVPHGVDTEIFKPHLKGPARKIVNLPEDRFIVGMVAANKGHPSRKAFVENIAAFAEFHKRHKDTLLFLHTAKAEHGENGGVNLVEFCQSVGLQEGVDVGFSDQYIGILGFPDAYMVSLYNSIDVLLSVSMGEGFGIPILEAQACGTPVIVGDWTSMGELCFGGWKVARKDAVQFWTGLGTYQFLPKTGAIVECLEQAYRKGDRMKKPALDGAKAYDADLVTNTYWRPVLEGIKEKIDGR
jgi:glycosyltransferase involved in cell wall biosynthesis